MALYRTVDQIGNMKAEEGHLLFQRLLESVHPLIDSLGVAAFQRRWR
jgi:hypothetical protein